MSGNKVLTERIEWLKVLLALSAAAFLVAIYIAAPVNAQSPRWLLLLTEAIPSALVVLTATPVVYFLLYKHGLDRTEDVTGVVRDALKHVDLLDTSQISRIADQVAASFEKKGLITAEVEYIGDFFTAARKIKDSICDGHPRHKVKIRVITARGTLESYMNEISGAFTGTLEVELQVADFSALPETLVDPRWPDEQQKTVTRIADYCRGKGYKLTVWRYPYSTSVVGHLIDDQHLLLAFYTWDKHMGAVADLQEWYMYFRRSPSTNRFFELFENWFDYSPRTPWLYDTRNVERTTAAAAAHDHSGSRGHSTERDPALDGELT